MSNATMSPARPPQRSATNRKLLGVCAGFAERYDLDPLLVRITVAVLALFGGLGILLYLGGAAWLPEPGDDSDSWSRRRLPLVVLAIVAALIVLPKFVFGFGDGAGFLVTAGLIVLLVLLVRREPGAGRVVDPPGYGAAEPNPSDGPAGGPGSSAAAQSSTQRADGGWKLPQSSADGSAGPQSSPGGSAGPVGAGSRQQETVHSRSDVTGEAAQHPTPVGASDAADHAVLQPPPVGPSDVADYAATPYPRPPYPQPPYPPESHPAQPAYPAPPRKPKQRSYLGLITLCASLVWFGLAWTLNALAVTTFSAVTIFGGSLAILAIGMIVGAWYGRARWLVVLALPLALLVWGLALVPDAVRLGQAANWVGQGIGEVAFQPTDANPDDFSWGYGYATLDVADWVAYPLVDGVQASVGVGELVIDVPDTWNVVVDASLGYGSLVRDGITLTEGETVNERVVFAAAAPTGADAPQLHIRAMVDVGHITLETVDTFARSAPEGSATSPAPDVPLPSPTQPNAPLPTPPDAPAAGAVTGPSAPVVQGLRRQVPAAQAPGPPARAVHGATTPTTTKEDAA